MEMGGTMRDIRPTKEAQLCLEDEMKGLEKIQELSKEYLDDDSIRVENNPNIRKTTKPTQ